MCVLDILGSPRIADHDTLLKGPAVKTVAINALPPSELAFDYDGGAEATFLFPAAEGETPRRVTARTDGTVLRFFPERAAGHREVLKILGL